MASGLRKGKGGEERNTICAMTRSRCGVGVPRVGFNGMSCVSIAGSVVVLDQKKNGLVLKP